mgnify:CR=1 FL=1
MVSVFTVIDRTRRHFDSCFWFQDEFTDIESFDLTLSANDNIKWFDDLDPNDFWDGLWAKAA